MSLYGALYAGVAGLQAQSNKLGIISDNIANVNTTGYKQGSALFETLVTNASNATAYSPGGVLGANQQHIDTQGLLQSTDSPTDIAISGGGFFVVNQTADGSGQVLYTRAGSFTQDSSGNFRNAAGFFLQAWPLDRDGQLPGAPGNLNTTSSANLASLQTVNVQNLTGSAAATTNVALGANLNAAQTAYPGASGTVTMDNSDTNNDDNAAATIIVPTSVDSIVVGDQMTVTTGGGLSYTYTYGGFSTGRSVTAGTGGDAATTLNYSPDTIVTTAATSAIGGMAVTNGSSTVTVTTSAAHNFTDGDYVTISGLSSAIGGIAIGDLNGSWEVTVVDSTTFTFTSTGTGSSGAVSTEAATVTPTPFVTTNASNTVTVSHTAHGLAVGEVVTFSGISAAVNGIPASELNSTFVVASVIDANHYTITTPTTAATSTGAGGTGTITAAARPFSSSGYILDATSATQTFLGTTGVSSFTDAGLTFTITTAVAGTTTFSYTSSSPNAQLGQFNTLTNLAAAINEVNGLTARVVSGRLYVGATSADDAVTFANGSVVGDSGPPVLSGIDWINELGLADVAAGSGRFSTMQGLADQINNSSGLDATISDALGDASVEINVEDPLDTITFADEAGNTGSILAALGLVSSLGGGAFTAQTTGALGPAYDPTDEDKNMAGGTIAPQFSRPVTVYDGLGSPHSLNIGFIKTGSNTWAVEVYAQPVTDVVAAGTPGQIAYGSIVFNGDGSLRSVSSTLSAEVDINWTSGASTSGITFNWGTAGQPFGTSNASVIGLTDGLSQFTSSYNVNFVDQNGAPVGQLTAVSIDDEGYITASYSNGETQQLYKIPLASFTDPNNLQSLSGNTFAQTSASGEVNLKEAGTSGVGTISAATLEASNVELASQLTDMIVAQRAYQANTKVISTSDQLLSDLDQILR